VLATLVTGPYKGTMLVGSIQEAKQVTGIRPKALILAFNSMNIPDQPKSVSVNAVAIDPDTARTALASNVDSHKAERYGALFTSSFMQGYGNAITQAGSTTFNNSDGSQTQVLQQLSPQQEIFAGLGEVGNRWGQELSESFKRPNTITIDPGLSVGILFMADVAIE
jgi:intracellular multiplication protein IcmE